jgi:EAL domain-containing protein (putative c-di-GMP-specific phosphodiesterase class I)
LRVVPAIAGIRGSRAVFEPEDVRAGMERGELFLEYLPAMALAAHYCVGAEALVRWRRAEEIITAGQLMAVIENTPLSGLVTYWIIDTVAAELGDWLRAHGDAHISINVPPEILGRGGLEYAADRTGLRACASQIVLEITERGVPDRLGLQALDAMVERGVHVALDDTTLSGANLALVARGKFEIIKLDRLLVAQIRHDAPLPDWLPGLSALLGSSSLIVVAEGVESPYQAEVLRNAGVQVAQGYLFSVPLTARRFKQFFRDHHWVNRPR